MSNRLSMATHQSIESLHRSGHSNREIARLLSIDRGAVNKHVRQLRSESQAQKESGSAADQIQNRPNAPTGSEADLDAASVQSRPQAPTGSETPEQSPSDVERADLRVLDTVFHLALVFGRVRFRRQDGRSVMCCERLQLRMEFRIVPVGFGLVGSTHRRPKDVFRGHKSA